MRNVSIMEIDAGIEAMNVGVKTWGTYGERRRPNVKSQGHQS